MRSVVLVAGLVALGQLAAVLPVVVRVLRSALLVRRGLRVAARPRPTLAVAVGAARAMRQEPMAVLAQVLADTAEERAVRIRLHRQVEEAVRLRSTGREALAVRVVQRALRPDQRPMARQVVAVVEQRQARRRAVAVARLVTC
jgi:hypothetical protein